MDAIVSPLTILFTNLLAALVLAIVKDLVSNIFWGETPLVLQKLTVIPKPTRTESPHVQISGRRAGFIGYVLTLFDLSPSVQLTANAREVRKSTMSLHGDSLELIPLSDSVSVQADSRRSLLWLVAAILSLTVGVASGLLMGDAFLQQLLNATAWLVVAGIFLSAFYLSHRFQIVVHGTLRMGVSFKPSVLEGRAIHFQDVVEAVEVLMQRIQDARSLGGDSASSARPSYAATTDSNKAPLSPVFSPGGISPPVSLPLIAPAVAQHFDNANETITESPFPLKTPLVGGAKKPRRPDRSNTGTVEYGEDQPAFEAAPSFWSGDPEPGTSDSIQLRQSITRSETGMFLNVPEDRTEYDEEELDDHDTDSNINAHRGTVSWEEHADKTQDEIRAEAELADLKRSRPKRGEAKLRLRELMRRFPQTDAANKARRMLERLESGG